MKITIYQNIYCPEFLLKFIASQLRIAEEKINIFNTGYFLNIYVLINQVENNIGTHMYDEILIEY